MGLAVATFPLNAGNGIFPKEDYKFQLGIASYSLRKFSMEDALKMTERLGIRRIAFKDFHLKLNASDAEINNALEKTKNAGIKLYGGGVIYMRSNEEIDQAFEYARKAGMEIIIGVPSHDLLPYVEKKVKEYNIKLAIHNHGPGDKIYPSAESAFVKIKNMDPGMGLCIDIGHTVRIKGDPVQDLKNFFDRVHDIHIKDVTMKEEKGQTCEIGRGVIDIPAFIKTVVKLGYSGTVALEYEKDESDPLPGMAESIGYIKGVLAVI